MQLPIKAHYAALAMLALADKYAAGELLPARVIASQHGIPGQFLGQILQQLRSAGLITSTRGASGGFQLSHAPDKISMADVVESVCAYSADRASADDCSEFGGLMVEFWSELDRSQRKMLQQVTLDELLSRSATGAAQPMFYI